MDTLVSKCKALLSSGKVDADGAPIEALDIFSLLVGDETIFSGMDHERLRDECWRVYHSSPFVQTAVSDSVGALVGHGFSVDSDVKEIADLIETQTFDWRNQLNIRWRQFSTSHEVTGELYLCLSLQKEENFIHTDMISPSAITGIGKGGCGIIFHPNKTHIPIVYGVKDGDNTERQIPSIYVAYQPSLLKGIDKAYLQKQGFNRKKINENRSPHPTFKDVGGFHRFITDFEGPLLADRGMSHLRSILIWWNLYALMKGIEIDHKRACSAYAYMFTATDQVASDRWLELTDEQRASTGMMAEKVPGSNIVLPYGFTGELVSAQLPAISDADSDLRELVVSGLNQPSDVVTGTSQGKNFGSVKASRGPWSDRILQKQHDFEQPLVHKFWHPIFFLHSKAYGFKDKFKAMKAVRFEKKKAVFEEVSGPAWKFLEVSLPIYSAGGLSDLRALYLGSKSGPLDQVLGVPKKEIARRLGLSKYRKLRLQHAEENRELPDLSEADVNAEKTAEDALKPSTEKI